jgi:hypothetical protein
MKRFVAGVCCTLFLITAPSIAVGKGATVNLDKAPDGIVPTTAILSKILSAHQAAIGRLQPATGSVRTDIWNFTDSGTTGSERLVRQGSDYHSVITTGPFTEEYGQSGFSRWYMNENGAVTDTTSADFRSFDMFRVLDDANDPKNDVTLLGETTDAQPAYVVEVKRPHEAHPEWLYFDKKTALVTSTIQIIDDRRITSTYGNYQMVRGLTEPAHVHDSDGTASLDDDYQRQSATFSNTVSPNEFAKPPSRANFALVNHPVDLKARIVRNTVIIRLNVNGRGLDFELSSGDPHSFIDSEVARELNLPTFGHVTQAEGEDQAYETKIATAWAGDLYVQNFALEALPFSFHADDFLSQGFFTVDYVNGRVTATPNTVAPFDAFGAGLDVIPVWFDDGQPFFSCTIGDHGTNYALLDSSFELSYVLGSFTQEYPDAVPDLFRKQHTHAIVPFADSGSYGRDLDIWLAKLPTLQVGPMNFVNYDMFATDADLESGDHPIDAVIGSQFLQFFDVSYDFAHSRVLLKENAYFHRSFRLTHN